MFLAAVHFALLLGVLAGKPFIPYPTAEEESSVLNFNEWKIFGDMVAARYFHFTYESLPVQALMLLDLPAIAVGGFTVDLIAAKLLHRFYASYVAAASWLLLGSLQWYLVGRAVERKWLRPKVS